MTDGIRPYLLLSLLCALLYLPGISSVPPFDRDESRFAQASKQMIESGDFVDIRFMDEPRHKKPAGIYWLQATFVSVFSDVEAREIWAYRLPSVIAAWATVLISFVGAQAFLSRRAALLASVLLACSAVLILEAHQAKTDATLLFTVIAAQAMLARQFARSRNGTPTLSVGAAVIFWVALGVGILIKGPIAPMVVALTALVLAIWVRDGKWLGGLRPTWGVPVMLGIAAPWVIAIWLATDGAFFREAVGHDMLGKVVSGQDSHGAPPGYHLLLLNVMAWPGVLVLVPALVGVWRYRSEPLVRFCIAWIVPAWLVFEITATKLPHYTSPTYPAIAWLAAYLLIDRGFFAPRVARGYAVFWSVIALAAAGGIVFAPFHLGLGFLPATLLAVLFAAIAVYLGVTGVWNGLQHNRVMAASVAGGMMLSVTIGAVMPQLSPMWLSSRVQNAITTHFEVIPPVVSAGFTEPSLVFLTRSDILFSNGAGALGALQSGAARVAVVDEREVAAFLAAAANAGVQPKVLASIDGLNYSKGDEKILQVITLE